MRRRSRSHPAAHAAATPLPSHSPAPPPPTLALQGMSGEELARLWQEYLVVTFVRNPVRAPEPASWLAQPASRTLLAAACGWADAGRADGTCAAAAAVQPAPHPPPLDGPPSPPPAPVSPRSGRARSARTA